MQKAAAATPAVEKPEEKRPVEQSDAAPSITEGQPSDPSVKQEESQPPTNGTNVEHKASTPLPTEVQMDVPQESIEVQNI